MRATLARFMLSSGMLSTSADLSVFAGAGGRGLEAFCDAGLAFERIARIYDEGVAIVREAFERFTAGHNLDGPVDAFYPFLGIAVTREALTSTPGCLRRVARSRASTARR